MGVWASEGLRHIASTCSGSHSRTAREPVAERGPETLATKPGAVGSDKPLPRPTRLAQSPGAAPSPSHRPAFMRCGKRLLAPLPAYLSSGQTNRSEQDQTNRFNHHQNDRRREDPGSPALTGSSKYEGGFLLGLYWPSAADALRRGTWAM